MAGADVNSRACELYLNSSARASAATEEEEIEIAEIRDFMESSCSTSSPGPVVSDPPENDPIQDPPLERQATHPLASALWTRERKIKPTTLGAYPKGPILKEGAPGKVKRVLIMASSITGEISSFKGSDRFDAVYVLNDGHSEVLNGNLEALSKYLREKGIFPEELTIEAHGGDGSYAPKKTKIGLALTKDIKDISEDADLSFFPSEKLKLIRITACYGTEGMADHLAAQWKLTGEILLGVYGVNFAGVDTVSTARFPMLDLERDHSPVSTDHPIGERRARVYVNGQSVTDKLALPPTLDDEKGLVLEKYRPTFSAIEFTGWKDAKKYGLINAMVKRLGKDSDQAFVHLPKVVRMMQEMHWNYDRQLRFIALLADRKEIYFEKGQKWLAIIEQQYSHHLNTSADPDIAKKNMQTDFLIESALKAEEAGKRIKATELYEKALALSPEDLTAQWSLSFVWVLQCEQAFNDGHYELAEYYAKRALEVEPSKESALFLLRDSLMRQDRVTEAATIAQEIYILAPNASIALWLGETYSVLNRRDLALLWFEKACILDPNASIALWLGETYSSLNRRDLALLWLEKACDLDPVGEYKRNRLRDLYSDLVEEVLSDSKRTAESVKQAEMWIIKALEIDPTDYNNLVRLVKIYSADHQNKPIQRIAIERQLNEQHSNVGNHLIFTDILIENSGSNSQFLDEAEKWINKVLDREPKNAKALDKLALIKERKRNLGKR